VIVLDTTVLVYAKGADHSLRDPCRELVAAIAAGRIEATTTPEVVQEFVHVRARRRDRGDAAALGRDYAELLSPLLSVTQEHLRHGLELFEAGGRLGAFDAVLAAAATSSGAEALVSADAAFAEIEGLRHVVPDVDGIANLSLGAQ
jgi:predicted nucleic acid-binding protein